jgi:2,4-dienoyl-CoA reductase-like NADH-dependent reductase (Old Yellow Enzyme family)/NADPH-dependent 2,4-dienoyl-CoA reductase/sulfur reductase-like enzyme
MKYPNLFSPIKVGNVTLKNRIVMPPMDSNQNNMDGSLSRKCMGYLSERARGGAGLIIMEAVSVDWPRGKISERQLDINNPNVSADINDLVEYVHSFGAKIIPQIHHGGFLAYPELSGGAENISASDSDAPFPKARAMTLEEIKYIEGRFINAAVMAKRAGFDGVEVHASHMYLLSQFISPLTNRRTDEYGGSMENRMRIVVNIIKGIREDCGPEFLLDVRLGVMDAIPGGNTLEDGAKMALMCEEAGADMINLTTGIYANLEMMTEGQYQEEGGRAYWGREIKKLVKNAKVAVVGKLRTPSFCEKVIADGEADLVCIGRQLICDPFWPMKAETGKEDQIRTCLNCNEGCVNYLLTKHSGIRCVLNPFVGYEDLYTESTLNKAGVSKNVVIVGGGVAGMQAAITASKRGHKVTLLEKSATLGGQMILAAKPPYKEVLNSARAWFAGEVVRQGVDVKMNCEADIKTIKNLNPDSVIVTIGSVETSPPIPGIEKAIKSRTLLADESLMPKNKRVVVIGGGQVGCEVAHLIASNNNKVSIIEMLPEVCIDQEPLHKGLLAKGLAEHGVEIHTNSTATAVKDGCVEYKEGETTGSIECDLAVVSTGRKAVGSDLVSALRADGIEAFAAGDSLDGGNIRVATRSGFDVAMNL